MIVAYDPFIGAMRRLITALVVASMLAVSATPAATAQIGQPDIIQEHWYHSYATLTLDVNAWADDYPEIINLSVVGQTEMGRNLWMLQITDESCWTDLAFDGVNTSTMEEKAERAHCYYAKKWCTLMVAIMAMST